MLKGFRNSGKLFVISVATCLHSAMITIKRVTNDHDGDGDGDGDHDGDLKELVCSRFLLQLKRYCNCSAGLSPTAFAGKTTGNCETQRPVSIS